MPLLHEQVSPELQLAICVYLGETRGHVHCAHTHLEEKVREKEIQVHEGRDKLTHP
jgi:hypothetical protein